MIRKTVETIRPAVTGERMMADMRVISRYERYPASQGFHEAALYCAKRLEDTGIRTEIHSYPFTRSTLYQTALCEDKWVCREGWCELVEEGYRRIADYDGKKLSVAQLSGPCPRMENPAEVYYMEKGADQAEYEGVDLAGRVLLVKGRLGTEYLWAFRDRGAIGAIGIVPSAYFDRDVMGWAALRRHGWEDVFAFSVSPAEGDRLIELYGKLGKKGERMHVNCFVDAERTDGVMEVVDAFLPGSVDEELLIVAHLCHPQGSCNDNISGCVAGIEALRVLKYLTDTGRLAPLRRGVRLLLVPEMFGSYGFLTENTGRWDKMLAGINLDMVGASQDRRNGPLSVNETPRSMPSFTGSLAELILDELRRDEPLYENRIYVPLFNALLIEYRGGSDHAIYSDPSVGIPMPMFGQLPDRYYHSDHDLPGTIDPFILSKSCALAASYVYTLSNLEVEDAALIARRAGKNLLERAEGAAADALNDEKSRAWYKLRLDQYRRFYLGACDALLPYFSGKERDEVSALVSGEKERMQQIAQAIPLPALDGGEPDDGMDDPRYDRVPVRSFWASAFYLIGDGDDLAERVLGKPEAPKKFREALGGETIPNPMEHLISYYIDGRRTAREVIREVRTETGGQSTPEALWAFLVYLEDLGFLSFRDGS